MKNQIKQPKPGLGVTVQVGSDRYAGTITRVSASGKTFWFTLDGRSQGEERRAFLNKHNSWCQSGYCKWGVTLGVREPYRDPHF